MLHKHYFPNQQTPLLGRQIRSGVAILEKGNQGARSAKVSTPAAFGVDFFIFFMLFFFGVLVLFDFFLGGGRFVVAFVVCVLFFFFLIFVAFNTGTASGLACKSC